MNRNILISGLAIILASACAQKHESAEIADKPSILPDEKGKAMTQTQLSQTPSSDLYSDGKTRLIKKANYRFEVDNVKKSTDAIITAIKKYPAYVSSSSLHLQNPILENKMIIRIRSEYFHELLQEIDLQARFVNHRDVTTDDVSKDFVDLESRLKTKREVEARYIDILRSKAGTIEELLNAEQQIGALHEEIEATISRINFLREQVAYSTIELEFYQTITQEIATNNVTTSQKFAEALASGWNGVVVFTVALTYVWPVIIVAAAALAVARYRGLKQTRNALVTPFSTKHKPLEDASGKKD